MCLTKWEPAQRRSQWENHIAHGPAAGQERLYHTSLCWGGGLHSQYPAVRSKSTPGKHQELGFSFILKCKPACLLGFICMSKPLWARQM